MKNALLGLLLVAGTSYSAELTIDSSQSAFHVGSVVMVCGVVGEVKRFSSGTYINLGPRYPKQHIGILVWDKDTGAFNARFGSLSVFEGARACARGSIETYRNSLQMKVSNPQFLRLMK